MIAKVLYSNRGSKKLELILGLKIVLVQFAPRFGTNQNRSVQKLKNNFDFFIF